MTLAGTRPVAISDYSLEDRYAAVDGTVHLSGLLAAVRIVLDQHRQDRSRGVDTRTFISGYEGSPLAGLDLELTRRGSLLDECGVVFRAGLNEESAAMAVQGTQLAAVAGGMRHDGVVGVWYGRAPGLDRATDAIRHANLMGTHASGGVLALVGDDPGAKSSSVPSASELALADLGIPTLYPGDSQDVLEFGLHGVALSRASGLWTALKIVTAVADGSSTVQVARAGITPIMPTLEIDGRPWTHTVTGHLLQPTLGRLESDLYRCRLELARRYAAANELNRITVRTADDRIGIVAAGKTYLDLRQALQAMGLDDDELRRRGIRLLKMGMIHPLEPQVVVEFAQGLSEMVVVEEKRSFIEAAVRGLLYGRPDAPAVHGKSGPGGADLFPSDGELDPDLIAAGLAPWLSHLPTVAAWRARRATLRSRGPIMLPVVPRTPYFCSGCPHNSSTKPADSSLTAAGIGCHTMVLLMEPAQVGEVVGLTQMGGEGTQWIGMAPFVEATHLVQNLGDGTFHHSGSLAVRAAVAAGVDITYKLLHNATVAMTGGQDAVGALSVPDITRLLAVEGVARTIVTTDDPTHYRRKDLAPGVLVWPRERLVEAQRVLAATPGVTVLIHDQECAATKRSERRRGIRPTPARRVLINERVCEGCGDCGKKSNCLSVEPVETEFGRKTRIRQSSCNYDYSCLAGDCPSFLSVIPGVDRVRRTVPLLRAAELPQPLPTTADAFAVRLMGIGGTGVVTVSQILATAAVLAGRHVRGLDQTGLAQKGGAVVSDVKITTEAREFAGRVAHGECDLFLGADLLVAAGPDNLAAADPARTVAVVSTAQVPTGKMITDPDASFPDPDGLVRRISAATARATYLDARGLAERLFADDQYANMLLLGAAFQTGAVPLPTEAIERAIELNGVAVETNLQAFRRGRQFVAAPADLWESLGDGGTEPGRVARPPIAAEPTRQVAAAPGSELARLLDVRVPDLIAYQDAAYADRYVADVEFVRRAEASAVPGSTALAESVASNLYALMSYKDEYEVARLALDPATAADVRARFGPGSRSFWHLHPPLLRRLGVRRKVRLGRWFTPVFRLLCVMRVLRGTAFDPFGHTRLRKIERGLVADYRTIVRELASGLTPDTHAVALEIAQLPAVIRGYDEVKLSSIAKYRELLAEKMPPSRIPNIVKSAENSVGPEREDAR